jgi:hypothetical protein
MSTLKRTIWQLQAVKVRQWCGKTAMRRLHLEEAIAVGDLLSSYCPCASFKTGFWALNYEIRNLFKQIFKNSFHCTEFLQTL